MQDIRVCNEYICYIMAKEMYAGSSFQNIEFRSLVEGQVFKHCEGFHASIDFVFADLGCNIRRDRDNENANHHIFAHAEKKAM